MARVRKALTATALGAAAFALVAVAAGTTGAYFSESAPGAINGTLGSVHLATGPTTFNWTNMMPGEPKSATVDFQNSGTGNQDFYLVFKNVPALHAINNLGSYGEAHIADGNGVHLFDSTNLQDGRHQTATTTTTDTCGGFTPAGCWPIPVSLKLASNVAFFAWNSFTFSFNYPGKLGGIPGKISGGGSFNTYPLSGTDIWAGAAGAADGAGPAGAGLPYDIVAVQVGQTP